MLDITRRFMGQQQLALQGETALPGSMLPLVPHALHWHTICPILTKRSLCCPAIIFDDIHVFLHRRHESISRVSRCLSDKSYYVDNNSTPTMSSNLFEVQCFLALGSC